MTRSGDPGPTGWWCPPRAGADLHGYAGAWLSAEQMLPLSAAAPAEHLSGALAVLAEVAAGLASVDLGEWEGSAARAARGRLSDDLLRVGGLESRLLEAQTALDQQERAIRQALLAAAGAC
ncbi:hypothetical protein ACFQ23_08460 [Schaalia naturae]|uniref:Uncharacterized protein n=1 Tax=Schaalia naturae TaxID=635203 RepID=A0ABW2SPR8_9ACTO